jgi:hypothetical protein
MQCGIQVQAMHRVALRVFAGTSLPILQQCTRFQNRELDDRSLASHLYVTTCVEAGIEWFDHLWSNMTASGKFRGGPRHFPWATKARRGRKCCEWYC